MLACQGSNSACWVLRRGGFERPQEGVLTIGYGEVQQNLAGHFLLQSRRCGALGHSKQRHTSEEGCLCFSAISSMEGGSALIQQVQLKLKGMAILHCMSSTYLTEAASCGATRLMQLMRHMHMKVALAWSCSRALLCRCLAASTSPCTC